MIPPRVIDLPDTVSVGQTVQAIVRTVLPDGCWHTDGQTVEQSALSVEITPQDARSDAEVCTLLYGYGAHTVSLVFPTRGIVTVRVHGRRLVVGGQTTSESVTAERLVVVR